MAGLSCNIVQIASFQSPTTASLVSLITQGGTVGQATEISDILRAKLYRPRLSEALVERPRVLEPLNTHRRRPLTLVSAAAGYGKTTLVSSWLEASDFPSAWLSLDERDDDLVTFLTYFIADKQAIFRRESTFGDEINE